MKKIIKVLGITLSAATLMSGLSFTAFADGTEGEDSFEKIVNLKADDTAFNRVVAKGAPADVEVYYSDDNGATWTNMDQTKIAGATVGKKGLTGYINTDGVIGYLYAGNGNAGGDDYITGSKNGNYYTYATYTADQIKLVSHTTDVKDVSVKVYNATDVAPTNTDIKKDTSVFTAESENGTKLYTENIYNGERMNNNVNSNPAYIYNNAVKNDEAEKESKGEALTTEKAVIALTLSRSAEVSQISFGNGYSGFNIGSGTLGSQYTVRYAKGTEWKEVVTNTLTNKNCHQIVNFNEKAETNAIQIECTYRSDVQQLAFGYIGVYSFGENLAEPQAFSEAVDLGKTVTFNTLTSEGNDLSWQYSEDNKTWNGYEKGTDMTARYIRAAADEGVAEVPSFSLSWNGNLVEYAGKQYNGASIGGQFHNKNVDWSLLYDEANNKTDGTNVISIYPHYKIHHIQLNLNAPAEIKTLQAYWQGVGYYVPSKYVISSSNKGTVWKNLLEQEHIKTDISQQTNPYTDGEHTLNVTAAVLKLEYLSTARDEGASAKASPVNTTELVVNGIVPVVEYNGSTIFPVISDDEEPEKTPAAAENTFVKNVTDETEGVKAGTKATVILSEINANDTTVSEITWKYGEKHAKYSGTIITGGTAFFGLVLDWSDRDIPEVFGKLSEGASVNDIITTEIK